ncbi:hypothetical protein C0J52_02546 [Blattella germanica]|nr:hypothetical protein C0J52_02546 [Blattella germanica]
MVCDHGLVCLHSIIPARWRQTQRSAEEIEKLIWKFLTLSCRSRAWMEVPLDATGHPRARIRLDHSVNPGVIVDRSSFKDWCKDNVDIKVGDLNLELNMSTVTGLTDLVEDELMPQPLPIEVVGSYTPIGPQNRTMPYKNSNGRVAQTDQSAGQSEYSSPPPEEVSAMSSNAPPPPTINIGMSEQSASMVIENIKICLNEDRPSANITSPGPIPINLQISQLNINRGLDGIFHIEPPVAAVQRPKALSDSGGVASDIVVRQLAALEHSNKQLQAENTELKRRLSALERVSKENHTLRQSTEESQILRSCLATAQDDVASLLEEKRSLLDRVRSLQDQVDQSQRSKR